MESAPAASPVGALGAFPTSFLLVGAAWASGSGRNKAHERKTRAGRSVNCCAKASRGCVSIRNRIGLESVRKDERKEDEEAYLPIFVKTKSTVFANHRASALMR